MSWFRTMRERYMCFPDDYVVFDVETTGLTPGDDLITQVGFCLVQDRNVEENGSSLLDWTRCEGVDQDWLRWRLAETKRQMEAKGKQNHMTYERLRDEGEDPLAVLKEYATLFGDAKDGGYYYLGHNALNFDIPFFQAHFTRWGPQFNFDSALVVDTGLMEKAAQLNFYPWPGESLVDFYARVYNWKKKGVFWSLDRNCVPKYKLDLIHGLDMTKAHDAGFDCILTHHLFEHYRELAELGGITIEPASDAPTTAGSAVS
jgi:DNA polymerase III epsilon subunit-like protein